MTSPGNLPQYLKPTPGPSIEEKFGEGEAYSAGRGPCWPLFAPRCVDGHDPQGHSSGQGVPARRHVLKNVNPVGYNHESHPTGWLDWDWLAGPTGLEPATSGVTGRRSSQLNYDPVSLSWRPRSSDPARPAACPRLARGPFPPTRLRPRVSFGSDKQFLRAQALLARRIDVCKDFL